MVFTTAGTVYYGTFKAGKPEGQCTALQVVDLDAPRYDYSQGIWKDGRMEGKGHTGYCYFERSPEGEARDICKTGTFSLVLLIHTGIDHITFHKVLGECSCLADIPCLPFRACLLYTSRCV